MISKTAYFFRAPDPWSSPDMRQLTSLATATNDRLLSSAVIDALVPNAAQTASTISGVVVSSQLIANRQVEPPQIDAAPSARATTASVAAPVLTVMVSK